MIDDEAMTQPVEPVGGDTGLHIRRDEIEHLGGEPPRLAHAGKAVRPVQADLALVERRLVSGDYGWAVHALIR